jgi:hypothetical protein
VVSFMLSIFLGYDAVNSGKELPFTVVVYPDSTIIDNHLYAVHYLWTQESNKTLDMPTNISCQCRSYDALA